MYSPDMPDIPVYLAYTKNISYIYIFLYKNIVKYLALVAYGYKAHGIFNIWSIIVLDRKCAAVFSMGLIVACFRFRF